MRIRVCFVLAWTFLAMACAFSEPERGTDPQEFEDRRELLQSYRAAQGIYFGHVETIVGEGSYPVELALYVVEVFDGFTREGEARPRPQLRGRLRRLDSVELDSEVLLEGRFYRETNELVLSNARGGLSSDDLFSIRGNLRDGEFRGQLTRERGVLGLIQMERRSSLAVAPPLSRAEELRARIIEQISPLEGTYTGTYVSEAGEGQSYPVRIRLFVTEEPRSDGEFYPVLSGFFERRDVGADIGTQLLRVRYQPSLRPPEISMLGQPLATTPTAPTTAITLRGLVREDFQIEASMFSPRSRGTIVLTRAP